MSGNVFEKLGIPKRPVMLAPLAGVSDHPFRRLCTRYGADLTYVEMISATAMVYESKRTFDMLKRHESEGILGVQITGKTAEETGQAIAMLDKMPFDTIDINMGCPVSKVVKTGCGSGILRDPQRVYDTVKRATENTSKPVSAKIRIGWDRHSINATEVADAAERGGAAWVTVHGRTRSDDYSVPVSLDAIAQVKKYCKIPVIGNGNVFGPSDAGHMLEATNGDGVMVSRGALGDPWVFGRIKGQQEPVSLAAWCEAVGNHLRWQKEEYGSTGKGAVCMRKHILWYLRGWPGVKAWKDRFTQAATLDDAESLLDGLFRELSREGVQYRSDMVGQTNLQGRFAWDPKYEMDRQLDRGVGDDGLL